MHIKKSTNMNCHKLLLYLITFFDLFAVGLVVPLINSHVSNLGGSQIVIGLMGSFYSGLQLFSGPILGALSDIKGRKPILISSLLCCSICYLLFGFISSIYVLLFLRILLGVSKHTQMLSKAFVSDLIDSSERSEIFGKMAAISGVGITLGPLLGGHILEDNPKHGFSIACSITFMLFVVNAGITYIIDSKSNEKLKKKKTIQKTINYLDIVIDSWRKLIEELKSVDWILYWDAFLLKGVVGFGLSIFYSIYSPLMKNYYGLSPKWIGYTISFQGAVGVFISFFFNRIFDTFYKTDVDFVYLNYHSFLLLSLTFFGLLLSNTWYLFIVLLIPLGTGNAILRLVMLEVILKKCPENQKGSLIGASNSVRSISGIIGPLIAGIVSDVFGVQYVLTVSLASVCFGALIAMRSKNSYIKAKKM